MTAILETLEYVFLDLLRDLTKPLLVAFAHPVIQILITFLLAMLATNAVLDILSVAGDWAAQAARGAVINAFSTTR